jgi:hypothetical protein
VPADAGDVAAVAAVGIGAMARSTMPATLSLPGSALAKRSGVTR